MRPHRDAVVRLSIRQIRAQMSPKAFAELKEVSRRLKRRSSIWEP